MLGKQSEIRRAKGCQQPRFVLPPTRGLQTTLWVACNMVEERARNIPVCFNSKCHVPAIELYDDAVVVFTVELKAKTRESNLE